MGTRPRVARAPLKRAAAKRATVVTERVEPAETEPPLRPGQCRAHMRKVLAKEFRGIVAGFVEGAKSGSCQHVKLATELLETRRRAPSRPSGGKTIRRLIRRMEQIDE